MSVWAWGASEGCAALALETVWDSCRRWAAAGAPAHQFALVPEGQGIGRYRGSGACYAGHARGYTLAATSWGGGVCAAADGRRKEETRVSGCTKVGRRGVGWLRRVETPCRVGETWGGCSKVWGGGVKGGCGVGVVSGGEGGGGRVGVGVGRGGWGGGGWGGLGGGGGGCCAGVVGGRPDRDWTVKCPRGSRQGSAVSRATRAAYSLRGGGRETSARSSAGASRGARSGGCWWVRFSLQGQEATTRSGWGAGEWGSWRLHVWSNGGRGLLWGARVAWSGRASGGNLPGRGKRGGGQEEEGGKGGCTRG